MNKLLAAALILGAAAVRADAQAFAPAEDRAALAASLAGFRERLAPAAVDPEPVRKLFRRLADSREGRFERNGEPGADGVSRHLAVILHELPEAEEAGEGSPAVIPLVYTRTFSHIEAVDERQKVLPSGDLEVDSWTFEIGLGGSLTSAARIQMRGRVGPDGGFVPNAGQSRVLRMSPSDPAVQRRWQRLSDELLRLGPTVEA